MHIEIALDVNDAPRMIAFWSAVLGYEVEDEGRFDTPDRVYWSLVDPSGRGPRLVIQRVPEQVTAKPRLHIDVHEPDIEAAAARAVELGASRIDEAPVVEVGAAWIRLEDPEGNVFCIVQERRP
jgi:predicted enzyme related to lactoylglutathione lyase